jgi:hypothetical protein
VALDLGGFSVMPTPMNYSTQAIICPALDLQGPARARHAKRESAGDTTTNLTIGSQPPRQVERSQLFLQGPPNALPLECRLANSRLVIHGHGNPGSTHIMGDHGQWTPKQLAQRIEMWLDRCRIKHISLQMCFGGGNRGGQAATDPNQWTTSAYESFAHELARHCGFTQTIGAVTNVHTTHTKTDAGTGALVRTGAVVFTTVGGNYKQIGDKAIFYPSEDARWNNPHDPIKNPSLPSSNKARPW